VKSLLVSDIHANLPALQAVVDCEGTWDEVICLGDALVAGPFPDEVLSFLARLDAVCMLGNHDREVLEADVSAPAADAHWAWIQWTRRQLSPRNHAFLAALPETRVHRSQGLTLRLTHGVLPPEWGGRLWPDSAPVVFAGLASRYTEPVILFGHSHVQFCCVHGGTMFVNPGTVGAPYLGQAVVCYGVLEDRQFDLRATAYDAEETCRALDERVPFDDREFAEAWKACWRTGRQPPYYSIRDYAPLMVLGYRALRATPAPARSAGSRCTGRWMWTWDGRRRLPLRSVGHRARPPTMSRPSGIPTWTRWTSACPTISTPRWPWRRRRQASTSCARSL
jgi:putative phosphoesterase